MYLSRLAVDTASRAFRRDRANVHDMHRTLLSVFPEVLSGAPARQEHGVLWRLEGGGRGGPVLLVQSRSAPDWALLPDGYLAEAPRVDPLGPLLDAAGPGRILSFQLVAAPAKSLAPTAAPAAAVAGGAAAGAGRPLGRGRRVALREPADQLAWLVGRGRQHGYVIPAAPAGGPDAGVTTLPDLRGAKNLQGVGGAQRRNPISLTAARFEGRLVVTDAERFAASLCEGIGRGKAYGCGLLTVAEAG